MALLQLSEIKNYLKNIASGNASQEHTLDGLIYSNMGIGIRCVEDALVRAYKESEQKGILVQHSDAWWGMTDSMKALENLLDRTDTKELNTPCHKCDDSLHPYYTPWQYMCVLKKTFLLGKWSSSFAIKLAECGAVTDIPNWWSTDMKRVAHTCQEPGTQ